MLSCVCVLGLTGCLKGNNDTAVFAITTSSLPNGTVGQPYSTSLSGSGGTPPYTWSITPALPSGLSLNTTTGAITGTPVSAGTGSHTFTLRDSTVPPLTAQTTLTLTINPAPAGLSITTTSLPDGNVGQSYNQPLLATGGSGPLTWSIAADSLPPVLSLDPTTGVIAGTPTAEGTWSFTVRVADTGGQEDTQVLSILINPPSPPSITTPTLPDGTVGVAYSEVLDATGGTGTLVWSLSAGSLPTNLNLSSDGTISGTPTDTGTSNFTVMVTDAVSQSDSQPLSITIHAAPAPLTITTDSPLPIAEVGKSYSATVRRSGGVSPFIWSVTPELPTGLKLDTSNGKITGKPAAGTAGMYLLTFTVQDSSTPTNQTASKPLVLTIAP